MTRTKIAFLLQDFAIGGIETCLFNIARELNGEFEFHFIATHVKHIEAKFHDVGTAVYFPLGSSLTRYLKDRQFNLVQTHNLREYVDHALAAGIPLIIERIAGNRAASNSKKGVDWVIASNRGTLPLIEKNIDLERVTVIYNGVDMETINSFPADRLGFLDNDVIVGRVSRLGRGQNIHMLIRAMVRLSKKYPMAKLVVVGGTSRMPGAENVLPELVKLAKPMGANALFVGERDQPFGILQGFDIATCVSNHEGVPNSLIEAMAAGKPIVATDVGQVHELVHDGVNGILIPCNDEGALVQALEKLILNAKLRKEMGEAGRKNVFEDFNIKKQAHSYAQIYRKLLSEQSNKVLSR